MWSDTSFQPAKLLESQFAVDDFSDLNLIQNDLHSVATCTIIITYCCSNVASCIELATRPHFSGDYYYFLLN